jgi:MFS family permease
MSRGGRLPRVPAVLREEPQFRLLFAGQVLSILGDRVTALVLPFAVLAVGGGVGQVAVVSIAQFLPFVVLALPAGVWADRFDRKRIVLASDAARLLTQAVAATLLITGSATVPALVVLAALYGAADAFFSPAFTGLLPGTVAPANLQAANALRGLSYSVGSIAGPAVGGLLIAWIGTGGAFAFDAVTFAVSIACIARVRPRVVEAGFADGAPPEAHFLRSLASGWAEVRRRPWLLALLAGGSAYSVLVLPSIFVLGPVLSGERFGGPTGWALITVGFGIGSLVGDLILLRWRPRFALRIASIALIGASCQALFIGSGLGTVPVAVLEVVGGTFVTLYFTLWETSVQEHVPQGSLSRVASYDYLTSTGFIPLGNVVAAGASALVGVGGAILGMGGLGVLCAVAVLAVPSVRRLPRAGGAAPKPAPA